MYKKNTFESTYRRYPFPVLVDFGIALGRLFLRAKRSHAARKHDARKAPDTHTARSAA